MAKTPPNVLPNYFRYPAVDLGCFRKAQRIANGLTQQSVPLLLLSVELLIYLGCNAKGRCLRFGHCYYDTITMTLWGQVKSICHQWSRFIAHLIMFPAKHTSDTYSLPFLQCEIYIALTIMGWCACVRKETFETLVILGLTVFEIFEELISCRTNEHDVKSFSGVSPKKVVP